MEAVPPKNLENGWYIWEVYGKLSKQLSPLERVLVADRIKKETVMFYVNVYYPKGHTYTIPKGSLKVGETVGLVSASSTAKGMNWTRITHNTAKLREIASVIKPARAR